MCRMDQRLDEISFQLCLQTCCAPPALQTLWGQVTDARKAGFAFNSDQRYYCYDHD